MAAFDLVIFDLDGTLVPTEQIAVTMMSELMREYLEMDMSESELQQRYRGRDVPYRLADMEQLYGKPLPQTLLTAMQDRWMHALEHELEATVGAMEALQALGDMPICVASNSDAASISLTLKSTGLDRYFDHYFSGTNVPRPKPAPDVFLLAAAEMGAEPGRCLVVEDSVLGVEAAKAAGMSAVGFAGNDLEMIPELRAQNVPVIEHFSDLSAIVWQL